MRIIAGQLRGREVTLPKGSRIRPATGFVREMLMSLYTPQRLARGAFLDLCAGSGLVGFEALSRGARRAVFVESEVRTAGDIRETATRFGVADKSFVLRCDARRCMPRVAKAAADNELPRISAVFLDAPFIPGMAQEILERFGFWLAGNEDGNSIQLASSHRRPQPQGDGGKPPPPHDLFSPNLLLIARTPDQLYPERIPGLRHIETRRAGSDAKLWLFEPAVPGK